MIDLASLPLDVPGVPLTGPTGKRDNLARLYRVMAATLPPGRVLVMDVAHAPPCPCETEGRPMPACTCDTVDLRLSLVDPRAS